MLNVDFYRCQVKFNVMFAIRSTKNFLRKKSNGLGVTVVILGFTLHAWILPVNQRLSYVLNVVNN